MGKLTGFLDYSREDNLVIPPQERVRNFNEFHIPMSSQERMCQAARCMNCGVPLCQCAMKLSGMWTGCPLHNLIPEWNDQLYQGHLEEAYQRLHKTSSFPEFTSRVCPALCEKACLCGEYGDPVSVHENENFIIENAFANGYVKPYIPSVRSGRKVAVIGSGPSGLAVADRLNQRGHSVTVYERQDRVGGLLMYGIPNMKLDKSVVLRRQKLMEQEGVVFLTSMNVGAPGGFSAEKILQEYDAVVLCCGARQARHLNIRPDEMDIKGVYLAVDFLTAATKKLLEAGDNRTQSPSGEDLPSAAGRHVVVVGGGDTGNDCIATCLRQQCRSLTALEMMPQPPRQRAASNPWPEWPRVEKIDYGHEEYIARFGHDPRVYETSIKELKTDQSGKLSQVVTSKVTFENRRMKYVEGTEKTIPCDILLIAAGFTGCESYTADAFGVRLSERHTVEGQNHTYRTNVDKVFTAGDMHRGQSLVVWAIEEGRECARQVDEYLMGYTTME